MSEHVAPQHDPLCGIRTGRTSCQCAVIARVRADEREACATAIREATADWCYPEADYDRDGILRAILGEP